jgi:hypothetical protein
MTFLKTGHPKIHHVQTCKEDVIFFMFWFKSNLIRDLKVFHEILDQLANLDINE